ncbi:MAG TPA: GNAT family N-acetyltransferase [Candidatus Tumulicola sp.]|jgi:GNAT superfamily N-acetyltransferase
MRERIRPAEASDAALLADAWRAMSDELGFAAKGFVPDWRERLTAYFAAGIGDESQGWFLAFAGDELAGTAAVFVRASVTWDVLYRRNAVLAGVFVAPTHRRAGIARRLVTRAVEWARGRGCTHLSLRASPAAEPLYRGLGFEDDDGLVLKLS